MSETKNYTNYKNRIKPNTEMMDFGKLPPQAVDIEEAVLGAAMLESESLAAIIDILQPDSFYKDANKRIWIAIISLFSKNSSVDILTVVQELKRTGQLEIVGGAFYVTTLTNKVAGASNIEYHARIVAQMFIKRELIRIGSETAKNSYDDSTDCFELIEKAERDIFGISKNIIKKDIEHIGKITIDLLKELTQKETIEQGLFGTPSGLIGLDRLTGGWQKQDLCIIAARPAMGKTALVLSMARNAAVEFNRPVAVFSLEMSALQLVTRLVSSETEISNSKFKRLSKDNKFENHEWKLIGEAQDKISKSPLYIDDTPSLSIFELRAKARRLRDKNNVELIIIDYLQLMTGVDGKGNREQEISGISRGLKSLAKELNIPIIALSQLSRAVETRGGDKRPVLSDLRESGCLIGTTKIYCPRHKKYICIIDLVYQKNFHIFATDYKKVKEMNATKCFKSGTKQAFQIELLNFQKIGATPNHKFLTPNGWRKLQDLTTSDSLAIPINYNDSKNDLLYLDEEVSLIGHFLSNGSALKKQPIRYTCNILDNDLSEKVMSDAIAATANNVAPYFKDTIAEKKSSRVVFFKPTFHLTHGKTSPIADIMRRYGLWDKRAKEKFIPEELFFLSHKKTFILLKSMFSGDGCAYYKESSGRKSLKISYSSASEDLINGVQQLLQKVGIISFIKKLENKKKQVWFNLFIAGKSNIKLFVENIGFWNKRKQDVMISGWLKSRDNLAGWNKYEFNEERTICFMPIKLITDIGMQDVFDIEVPELHNFVANGMIVHNSIEQDADIVIFIHRAEYYGIMEDGNGNSTAGMAELIIAKHRNGPVDTVDLRYISQFTRFCDLESPYTEPTANYSKSKVIIPNNEFVGVVSKTDNDKYTPF